MTDEKRFSALIRPELIIKIKKYMAKKNLSTNDNKIYTFTWAINDLIEKQLKIIGDEK